MGEHCRASGSLKAMYLSGWMPGPQIANGHRFAAVCFDRQRRRVVGSHEDAHVLCLLLVCKHLPDNVLIELLDGLDLFLQNAFVPGFVGSFDVKIHHVLGFKRGAGGGNFPGIIGAEISGCPVDQSDL